MNTHPRNDFTQSIISHDQYQFEPIDQEVSSLTKSSNHSIQRPIPIHHSFSNVRPSTYVLPAKRNSTLDIQSSSSTTTINDSNNRTFPLSRSITTDQLASNQRNLSHRTNRLYYCPSVQDVLDALERRAAFDKESMV